MQLIDILDATVTDADEGLLGVFYTEIPVEYRLSVREQEAIRREMREINALNNQVRAASEIAAAEFATA